MGRLALLNRLRHGFIKLFTRYDFYNAWSLEEFFYEVIIRQNTFSKGWSPKNAYYEFGVSSATSTESYARAAMRAAGKLGIAPESFRIVGFDTFEGLPEKDSGADGHPTWGKGLMAYDEKHALEKIGKTGFPLDSVRLVKGVYSESLTPELREELEGHRPSIVNIDCDYYSSARDALEFLRPLLSSGTIFYFDDIWAFHGHPEYGELKAIREFNEEGKGRLTPFPIYGILSHVYVYSAKEWEYEK